MQILANCKCDFETVKALTNMSRYREKNPEKCFTVFTILYGILFVVIFLEMKWFGVDSMWIVLLVMTAVLGILNIFWYFQYPKIQYRAMAKLADSSNEYVFTEYSLLIATKSNEYEGKAEIAYSFFVKAYETSSYLFLYQTKNQVFAVDKSTVTGGTFEEIRDKLRFYLNDKYYICKY